MGTNVIVPSCAQGVPAGLAVPSDATVTAVHSLPLNNLMVGVDALLFKVSNAVVCVVHAPPDNACSFTLVAVYHLPRWELSSNTSFKSLELVVTLDFISTPNAVPSVISTGVSKFSTAATPVVKPAAIATNS